MHFYLSFKIHLAPWQKQNLFIVYAIRNDYITTNNMNMNKNFTGEVKTNKDR